MTNAKKAPAASKGGRVHVVLVPGFAGFDALGQVEYYAGVTPQFQAWKETGTKRRERVALHYFDNFPTAAVRTRAARLRSYLTKRITRGEIQPGDLIALVGHSTAGLDIRQLLWDLASDPERMYPVDGAQSSQAAVSAGDLLEMVRRVVFLSVPQWGTNIADWVRTYTLGRELVVADLRAAVAASQVPFLDKFESWLSEGAAAATKLNLLYAIEDALNEAETRTSDNPMKRAMAQEAASELELWLRHIATDFSAIDDLTAKAPKGDCSSPAHFTPEMRASEKANWKNITTQSYATLGRRPFQFEPGRPAPRWDLLNPATYPDFTKQEEASSGMDISYRTCYRACAGGPFTDHDEKKALTPTPFIVASEAQPIELWDNDGIVNTASMLWPNGEETLLVEADHIDILGHYKLVPANREERPRKYDAYDFFKSESGFNDAAFAQVWNHVFDFCTEGLA